MRIAQVNLQPDWGGAERHVLLLARGLQAGGGEVRLCCHPGGSLRRYGSEAGIPVAPVKALNQMDLSAALRLAARLWRFRPQVLHLHTPRDYVCGSLAGRLLRVPVLALTRHMLLPLKPMMRRIYARADAVICLSRILYDSLRSQGVPVERLYQVRSAIDIAEFDVPQPEIACQALRSRWGVQAGETAIGIVGRLVQGKGHRDLLEATTRLMANGGAVKLLIIGEGPERDSLAALAEGLGIADRVVFTGFCRDIPAALGALDIAVLASTGELLPLAVLEAMAAGLPVVATCVGGVPELVENEVTGLLVPPQRPEALASALRCLIADPLLRKRMGAAGRERVLQEFTLPQMIAETERVYKEAMRTGRG